MARKDHRDNEDIRKSSRTRFEGTVNGYEVYSHTLKNVYGKYIVLWNGTTDADWEAFGEYLDAKAAITARGPLVPVTRESAGLPYSEPATQKGRTYGDLYN